MITNPGHTSKSYNLDKLKIKGYMAYRDTYRGFFLTVFNLSYQIITLLNAKAHAMFFTLTINNNENYYTIADYTEYHYFCEKRLTIFDEKVYYNDVSYALYTNKGFSCYKSLKKSYIYLWIEFLEKYFSEYLTFKRCRQKCHRYIQVYKVISLNYSLLMFYIFFSG